MDTEDIVTRGYYEKCNIYSLIPDIEFYYYKIRKLQIKKYMALIFVNIIKENDE